MRALLLVVLLTMTFTVNSVNGFAQKVFITDNRSDADLKVFALVGSRAKADLNVYWVGFSYEASEEDGLWFNIPHQRFADKKIYYVDNKYDADLTIRFVRNRRDAGWVNGRKSTIALSQNF